MSAHASPLAGAAETSRLRTAEAARVAAAAKPRHVGSEVADYIRSLIFNGTLKGGERIPQDDLAAALNLSRLPIREALITLQAEGLVTIEPRRGAHVIPIEVVDIIDHYRIYGAVHGMAAAKAAKIMTPDQRAELRRLYEQMVATNDPAVMHDLIWDFHSLINRAGGSRRIMAVLRQLSRNLPREVYDAPPNTSAEARDGHARILAAIEAGAADAAAEACRDHMAWEANYVVERLSELGVLADAG